VSLAKIRSPVRVGPPDGLREGVPPLDGRPELLDLIAGAVRRHVTYLAQPSAQAIADTLLRTMMAAGFDVVTAERAGSDA
jgi:hypothetical protein